jgi:formylglycine-generating enzyme required for sulfatase activity
LATAGRSCSRHDWILLRSSRAGSDCIAQIPRSRRMLSESLGMMIASTRTETADSMVGIAGGMFLMGSDKHYPEERPAQCVTVDGFWIDRYAATNTAFTDFIAATGYVTFPERPLDPSLYPAPRVAREVIKGASYLCAPNFGQRYGPTARYPQALDTTTSHIGFRAFGARRKQDQPRSSE